MDIVEHGRQEQHFVGSAIEDSAASVVAPESAGTTDGPLPAEPPDETIFTVLAGHARTRAPAHLWITAAIGVIDAVAVIVARPSLWWVAAAFVVASAYGTWGLADHALADRTLSKALGYPCRRWTPVALHGIRGLAVIAGVSALFAAVVGFVVAAMGGLRTGAGW
jgi:hypothetical protein